MSDMNKMAVWYILYKLNALIYINYHLTLYSSNISDYWDTLKQVPKIPEVPRLFPITECIVPAMHKSRTMKNVWFYYTQMLYTVDLRISLRGQIREDKNICQF